MYGPPGTHPMAVVPLQDLSNILQKDYVRPTSQTFRPDIYYFLTGLHQAQARPKPTVPNSLSGL